MQWKDIIKFHEIFGDFFVGTEHNFRQSGTTDGDCTNKPVNTTHKFITGEILVRIIYLCNFIQLRRNILLNEINFTT